MMPSITTGDGVRLDYLERGDPGGRPVVLIAGFKAAATSWLYQFGPLAKAGFRVLALDTRGHGTSEKPDFGHNMLRRGVDVNDFLEALDLHDAVLVGQSMGGNTIWAWRAQFDPTRVSGIVIVDQTPKMLNSDDWRYGFYGYDASNASTMFAEGIPATGHGTPILRRGIRTVRLLRALLRGGGSREFTSGELELLGDHAQRDWRDTIARNEVPTLFVAGRESEVWPCEHAAASAALTAGATSVVIEKAGHATNVEQPASFTAELLGFLDRV